MSPACEALNEGGSCQQVLVVGEGLVDLLHLRLAKGKPLPFCNVQVGGELAGQEGWHLEEGVTVGLLCAWLHMNYLDLTVCQRQTARGQDLEGCTVENEDVTGLERVRIFGSCSAGVQAARVRGVVEDLGHGSSGRAEPAGSGDAMPRR